MDHNVIAWDRFLNDQEASNEAACNSEAVRNGFTHAVAGECEDGALGCINCPFRADKTIGEVARVAVCETVIWFPIVRMPDGDLTVQLFDENGDEPVWPGYFDGEQWIYVDGNIAHPTHWANMAAGPKKQANTVIHSV